MNKIIKRGIDEGELLKVVSEKVDTVFDTGAGKNLNMVIYVYRTDVLPINKNKFDVRVGASYTFYVGENENFCAESKEDIEITGILDTSVDDREFENQIDKLVSSISNKLIVSAIDDMECVKMQVKEAQEEIESIYSQASEFVNFIKEFGLDK